MGGHLTFVEEFKIMSELITALKRANLQETMFTALVLSASVFPGVLVIWMFKPALIDSASTSKLFLLACSFMVPLVLVNTILMGHFTDKHCKTDADRRLFGFGAGAAFTIIKVFMILAVAFLFSLSLKTCLIVLAVTEVLLVLLQVALTVAEETKRVGSPPTPQK